jgi:hypothetical protein
MKITRFLHAIALLALVALSTGCAVRYAARVPGVQPGYVDQRLGESTYQIKVGEAWPKDWPDLEKFAMYRAAEITESTGNRYFAVLNASSQTNSYAITLPGTSTTTATGRQVGNTTYITAQTTTSPATTTTASGGWYTLDFKVLSDDDARAQAQVVDSRQVKSDLQYFINSRR